MNLTVSIYIPFIFKSIFFTEMLLAKRFAGEEHLERQSEEHLQRRDEFNGFHLCFLLYVNRFVYTECFVQRDWQVKSTLQRRERVRPKKYRQLGMHALVFDAFRIFFYY